MPNNKKVLQYTIKADTSQSIKSLGELENQIDSLKEQIKDVNNQDEFNQLAKQIARATSELKDMELAMEGLDAEQKASEFGSFAGGLADTTTGAFALANAMGLTKSSMEETIETIASGIAIADGFRGGIEGVISAQKLLKNSTIAQTAATEGASIAQRILNAVMNANPVFLLITGITALVGIMAAYTAITNDARDSQELLNKAKENAAESIGEEISQLDSLIGVLENENTTRTQKKEAIQKLQEEYPEFLGNIDLEKTTQEELNAAIEKQIKLVELQAQAKALEEIKTEAYKEKYKELTTAITEQNVGFVDYVQSIGFGIDAQEIANRKTAQSIELKNSEIDSTNKLIDSINAQIGAMTAEYDARIEAEKEQEKSEEAAKKRADEARKRNEARLAEEQRQLEELQKLEDAFYLRKQSKEEQEVIKRQQQLDQELAISEGNATLQAELIEEAEKEIQAIRDKYSAERQAKADAAFAKEVAKQDEQYALLQQLQNSDEENEIADLVADYEAKFALAEGNAELEKALQAQLNAEIKAVNDRYRDEEEQAEKETERKKILLKQESAEKTIGMTLSAFGAINDIIQASAGESEQAQRKAFNTQKAFNLASAVANTGLAVTAALTAGGNPIKLATGAQFVEAGIAAATGAAQIISIAKTKFNGGGSVASNIGSSTSSAPQAATLNNSTLFSTGGNPEELIKSSNSETQQTPIVKAIVVESDITTTQNNVKSVKETASI